MVMPNFNHGHYLKEALDSVLAQSFKPLEVIVVDDASTDDSLAVAGELAALHSIVRVVKHERNMGVVATTNRGIQHASGDYVCGMAADDRLLPGLFEKSMDLLARNPQAGLCSAMTLAMDESGQELGVHDTPVVSKSPSFLFPADCLALLKKHGSWFVGNTVVYRRRVLVELGGFDPELRSYTDGFMCQVIALKHGACFIPEHLAQERMAENRYSKTIMADPGVALSTVGRATQLMQTTYRDLFPADFVDAWSKRQRYHLGLRTVLTSQRRQVTGLRKLTPSPSPADKVFIALLRLMMKVEYIIARLFLFARVKHESSEKVSESEP